MTRSTGCERAYASALSPEGQCASPNLICEGNAPPGRRCRDRPRLSEYARSMRARYDAIRPPGLAFDDQQRRRRHRRSHVAVTLVTPRGNASAEHLQRNGCAVEWIGRDEQNVATRDGLVVEGGAVVAPATAELQRECIRELNAPILALKCSRASPSASPICFSRSSRIGVMDVEERLPVSVSRRYAYTVSACSATSAPALRIHLRDPRDPTQPEVVLDRVEPLMKSHGRPLPDSTSGSASTSAHPLSCSRMASRIASRSAVSSAGSLAWPRQSARRAVRDPAA